MLGRYARWPMDAAAVPRAIFLGGEGVHYVELAPPLELVPWVATFWRLRSARAVPLRVIPDGCMDIINGDVVGSLSTAIVADLQPGEDTFGIRLRPGAFTALFGVPASELTDLRVPLEDVVDPRPLRQVAGMRRRPIHSPPRRCTPPTSGRWRRSPGTARHLHRRILAATGHSPKRLARIGRMQTVLAAGRGESWARTAAEFGYHDEAHMVNDVRRLASATPHAMLDHRERRSG